MKSATVTILGGVAVGLLVAGVLVADPSMGNPHFAELWFGMVLSMMLVAMGFIGGAIADEDPAPERGSA